jgi:hypothetical protein
MQVALAAALSQSSPTHPNPQPLQLAVSYCCSAPDGSTRNLTPSGRWSEGWCAFGSPVLLCSRRLSAGSLESRGHSSATVARLVLARSQSK